ncbi:hypothetical protein TA3x_002451 [Tundrisphaera sp. TA3]|uniref:hypothetical protein n=1 Tax=Tundrisphaera sp. TA3 TaxID=3435775 RepID=UPI003EBA9DE5
MDRHRKILAVTVLGLLAPAAGCRSMKPEVPPARPYANDGRQRKPIDFSSEGHPVNGAATAVFQPSITPNMKPGQPVGTGRDGGSTPFGAMPGPAYGGPGTSGLGEPPSPMPAAEMPGIMAPPSGPDLSVEPPSVGQMAPPSLDAPAAMGRPSDLPAPQ